MKYLVRKSFINVIGNIWMPNTVCAMSYDLDSFAVNNLKDEDGQITRESIEDWLSCHAGDFRSIKDFSASIEDGENTIEINWQDEKNEMTYNDCMYPVYE